MTSKRLTYGGFLEAAEQVIVLQFEDLLAVELRQRAVVRRLVILLLPLPVLDAALAFDEVPSRDQLRLVKSRQSCFLQATQGVHTRFYKRSTNKDDAID